MKSSFNVFIILKSFNEPSFTQMSVVEASFKSVRFLLRLIAGTVKQRMTSQNIYPFAKEIPTS